MEYDNAIINFLMKCPITPEGETSSVRIMSIKECDKPTRKGRYVTLASGLIVNTYFVGTDGKSEDIFVEFVG